MIPRITRITMYNRLSVAANYKIVAKLPLVVKQRSQHLMKVAGSNTIYKNRVFKLRF